MRKLKLQFQITIDGFISGKNGEMDWVNSAWTEDIKNYIDELTEPVDTILLGKNLATGFIPHWEAVANDSNNPEKESGVKFSMTSKIVFSKTLTKSAWDNTTTIENGDFVKKIQSLKRLSGGDIIVYGGGKFVSSLLKEGLIDELNLFINPAVIGQGMPIFQEVNTQQSFQIVTSNQFECGIVALRYILKKYHQN